MQRPSKSPSAIQSPSNRDQVLNGPDSTQTSCCHRPVLPVSYRCHRWQTVMVLPEAETQRPSTPPFPPFANQFEEVERIQTQRRAAAQLDNDYASSSHAASPNHRGPLTIRNMNPEPRDLPLSPSPNLQTQIDRASSRPEEPTPEVRRPNRLPRTTTYPGEVSLRPPHLRIRSPDVPNPSYDPAPTPRVPYPHIQGSYPRSNRPYLPLRPAPPQPPLPPPSPPPRTPPLLSPRTITHPAPPQELISIYALCVRPGDILAYGNKLNDGCTVTACYPDERRPDLVLRDEGEGGEVARPVRMNGGIRIRWRDGETGEMLSQLFEGLEVLEVRRGEDGDGEDCGMICDESSFSWIDPVVV